MSACRREFLDLHCGSLGLRRCAAGGGLEGVCGRGMLLRAIAQPGGQAASWTRKTTAFELRRKAKLERHCLRGACGTERFL